MIFDSFKKELFDHNISEVQSIINNEIDKGVSPDHIYVAGFSQGSVISYFGSYTDIPLLIYAVKMQLYNSSNKFFYNFF